MGDILKFYPVIIIVSLPVLVVVSSYIYWHYIYEHDKEYDVESFHTTSKHTELSNTAVVKSNETTRKIQDIEHQLRENELELQEAQYDFENYNKQKECRETQFMSINSSPHYVNDRGVLAIRPYVQNGSYVNGECTSSTGYTSDFKCENTPKVNCLDHQLEPTLESPRTTRDLSNNIVCVYDNCKNKCNAVNENCYTYHNGIVKAKKVYSGCVQHIPNYSYCRSLDDPNLCPDRWYNHETNQVYFTQGEDPQPYYVPRTQSYRMNKSLVPSSSTPNEYVCEYSPSHQ